MRAGPSRETGGDPGRSKNAEDIRRCSRTEARVEKSLRILHLEDDPNDMELVRSTLEKDSIDCEVEVVSDRPSFVTAFERGIADLILSDYSLPAFDGISALEVAQARCPDVPFLFVCGTIGEELENKVA